MPEGFVILLLSQWSWIWFHSEISLRSNRSKQWPTASDSLLNCHFLNSADVSPIPNDLARALIVSWITIGSVEASRTNGPKILPSSASASRRDLGGSSGSEVLGSFSNVQSRDVKRALVCPRFHCVEITNEASSIGEVTQKFYIITQSNDKSHHSINWCRIIISFKILLTLKISSSMFSLIHRRLRTVGTRVWLTSIN
jgi:hypothetical protein